MPVVEDFPPNYNEIKSVLGEHPEVKPIFAYGDTIYNPHARELRLDDEVHEKVHCQRQGANPDLWWTQYLYDPKFRLDEEVAAYGSQCAFVKKKVPRKVYEYFLDQVASALSAETYGGIISFAEARSKIRNFAKSVV